LSKAKDATASSMCFSIREPWKCGAAQCLPAPEALLGFTSQAFQCPPQLLMKSVGKALLKACSESVRVRAFLLHVGDPV